MNAALSTWPRVIREAGDAALLVELGPAIDERVNARAIALARAIRQAAIPGVRDVVSTYRSVAVFFHPLRTQLEELSAMIERAPDDPRRGFKARTVDVRVAYGGVHGPDLGAVARHAGLTESEVVARHASRDYAVFMLGFMPGFPYLGGLDSAIAMPRKPTPRAKVPAGSVGIAGTQTGIYPSETPGGWNLIGRTDAVLFDIERRQPSLVSPGDRIRFVPVDAVQPPPRVRDPELTCDSGRCVFVDEPGLLTTIQDAGRWGYQDMGVPVAGPMDPVAHRLANRLVGNREDWAALEITVVGPVLRLGCDATLAVTGADLSAMMGSTPMTLNQPIQAVAGTTLRFGSRRTGARAYVAFGGGVETPLVLRSRAVHLPSGLGSPARPFRAGDAFQIGVPLGNPVRTSGSPSAAPRGGARLRVLPGPHVDSFDSAVLDALQRQRFRIDAESNRMGYRLKGASHLHTSEADMISDAAFTGAIQVPPSGDPILLMADRPTTGGYPQIATVISADLPLAGQLAPGDWLEFVVCSRAEALTALIAQERALLGVG